MVNIYCHYNNYYKCQLNCRSDDKSQSNEEILNSIFHTKVLFHQIIKFWLELLSLNFTPKSQPTTSPSKKILKVERVAHLNSIYYTKVLSSFTTTMGYTDIHYPMSIHNSYEQTCQSHPLLHTEYYPPKLGSRDSFTFLFFFFCGGGGVIWRWSIQDFF